MKILEANAGVLTNFEVLNFLQSRGASKDPTRVFSKIAPSEFKVYDYLVENISHNQTREMVNECVEKLKKFKLAKAEVLNIINVIPSSLVGMDSLILYESIRLRKVIVTKRNFSVDIRIQVAPSFMARGTLGFSSLGLLFDPTYLNSFR
ncbi:hypothetical protein JRO89_XSUnG0129800 [Xanthoceras sorbifolium]|uniref:DNA-directed RNA polymerase III subunit RPC9 n=1 Tax=Xanthoceras sorbifolium TaxID=99658 RepID=A0ABQ8GZG6_9ROSI|nr:hypothetical protein JRO89_XSUnG0129800 [Xanthoceras sorbifolium]